MITKFDFSPRVPFYRHLLLLLLRLMP